MGESKESHFVGVRLMRKVVTRKTSSQYLRGMSKHSKTHLNNITMLAFGSTILLINVRARDMVGNANELEKGV
jgi:hypothetical protein